MSEQYITPEPNQEELTPSQEIAEVLSRFGEDYGFDPETVKEVSEQPFEDAFQMAYSYLTQAGLDAEEILGSFLEHPEDTTKE